MKFEHQKDLTSYSCTSSQLWVFGSLLSNIFIDDLTARQ